MKEFKSTLSRRHFVTLLGTTTAGLAMLGMTGCGGGGDKQPQAGGSAPAGEPVKGGTFKVALNRTISAKSLDPLYVDSTTADQVCQNYGDTLVQENFDQSEYLPCIATKWEISGDGLTYTFTIREGVRFQPGKFQDGRVLTAEDVAYSVNRAKGYWCNYLFFLDYAEAIDDKTVVCHLKSATATFLHELCSSSVLIVPKEEVEGWGEEFGMHPISTGPFMIAEHVPDQYTKLVKNPNYWGVEPYLDNLEYYIITEAAQALNALTTGEIDCSLNVNGKIIEQVQGNKQLELAQNTEPRITYMGFNLSHEILGKIEVRRALAAAIDRETLVKGAYRYGDGEISYLPVPIMSWAYNKDQEKLAPAYNPEAAKKQLADAGYPDGFKLTITVGKNEAFIQAATLIQEQLKAVGVDVVVDPVSPTEVTERYLNNTVELWINGQGGSADPATFVGYFLNSEKIHTNYNAFCYSNPETDAIIQKGMELTDQEERKKVYHQLVQIAMDECIGVFFATSKLSWGFNSKVEGYVQENKAVLRVCGLEGTGINVWKQA